MGLGLFDVSEADQELMSGVAIEYSGLPLAALKLTRSVLLYSLPLLVVILFFGNNLNPLLVLAKYLAILIGIILIKNTNPRLGVDQLLGFFWKWPLMLSVLSVGLALAGF